MTRMMTCVFFAALASPVLGLPSSAAAGGVARDSRLVGNWSRVETLSSQGASFSTMLYLQIRSNGTFTHRVGRSAGGWGDVGVSAPADDSVTHGKWRTQGNVVYVSDGRSYEPYARFYVERTKLMFTFADGSREVWYRQTSDAPFDRQPH